jgi:hypothetical protein
MALTLLKLVQPIYKIGLKKIRKLIGWSLTELLTVILGILDGGYDSRGSAKISSKRKKIIIFRQN